MSKSREHSPPPAQPSRLRAAWQVLRGERVVPLQLQAEWAEYKLTFNDLLDRFSSLLARQAKAERKRLREEPSSQSSPPQLSLLPSGPQSSKAQLRSLAAERLGLAPLRRALGSAQPQPHQVEESPE